MDAKQLKKKMMFNRPKFYSLTTTNLTVSTLKKY